MIEQKEKAELRHLTLEDMEQVAGGEFVNPTEWITACVVCMEVMARSPNVTIAKGPLR